jgi:hypothetical protein
MSKYAFCWRIRAAQEMINYGETCGKTADLISARDDQVWETIGKTQGLTDLGNLNRRDSLRSAVLCVPRRTLRFVRAARDDQVWRKHWEKGRFDFGAR